MPDVGLNTRGETSNMASAPQDNVEMTEINAKNDRNQMNKLRDCGLQYVSCSGKIVPAKTQPEIFCLCPQRCQRKLPKEKWKELFRQFYALADQTKQNSFLQNHIIIKSVHLHNWEAKERTPANKRRVTCKYKVPDLKPGNRLEMYLDKTSDDVVEVCQKAFMNVFGITEKRIRMQRERCIALLAPDYYRKLHNDRKQKTDEIRDTQDDDVSPMDLSTECNKDSEHEWNQEVDSEPLDLSNHSERSSSPIEIDKTKLYELADMLGVPRSTVDREMVDKYEQLVRKNLAKQKKELLKRKRTDLELGAVTNLKGISEQVVGLEDNFAILPIQTLNNGDLTITPVLGPVARPVENNDIMQVNSFFQNQLWRPEYIGLSSSKLDTALSTK